MINLILSRVYAGTVPEAKIAKAMIIVLMAIIVGKCI
jgi:hypothetical protein